MNKKGFTLVEILAVIVVLALIGALIIPRVAETISSSRSKSYKVSLNGLVSVFNDMVMDKKANLIPFSGCSYDFGSNVTDCGNIDYKGKLPSGGVLTVDSDGNVNGDVVLGGNKYIISNNLVYSKDEYRLPAGTRYVFNYTGDEQFFEVPSNGYYKLELWGAQGGNVGDYYTSSSELVRGGYGGYSVGSIYLNESDIVYVYVGGEGTSICGSSDCPGGYNGGGNGSGNNSYPVYSSAGGGASHMAFSSGTLNTLSNKIESILIVAGGGGGTSYQAGGYTGLGGSGGGISGVTGTYGSSSYRSGAGGTQLAGGGTGSSSRGDSGAFGKGGNGKSYSGGGGGGYYGGGASNQAGAGGGSGYVGYSQLSNASMFCYGCTDSDYTVSTIGDSSLRNTTTCGDGYSSDPVEKCAKSGNGYAVITYIGDSL